MSGCAPSPAPYAALPAGCELRPGGTALTDRALAACALPPGARLLDVGCGTGATLEHLAGLGYRAAGLDPSELLLERARRRNPRLELVRGRAERLPWPERSLDGVLCECVLSLLEQPGRALDEFRRVLRPGGHLVLSDLYRRGAAGSGLAGRAELEDQLAARGFRLLLWEDHTRALQELAARMVLASPGSLATLGALVPSTVTCASGAPTVLAGESPGLFCGRAGRAPGYCLLAARLHPEP
jgi:SAM-dependent methyltransferase